MSSTEILYHCTKYDFGSYGNTVTEYYFDPLTKELKFIPAGLTYLPGSEKGTRKSDRFGRPGRSNLRRCGVISGKVLLCVCSFQHGRTGRRRCQAALSLELRWRGWQLETLL